MKHTIGIIFGLSRSEIHRILPRELIAMRDTIMAWPDSYNDFAPNSAATVDYDESLLRSLLAWKSETIDGNSVVRSVREAIEYDVSDLHNAQHVELQLSEAVYDFSEVTNDGRAFEAYRDCTWCNRLRWKQVNAISVKLAGKTDFQKTGSNQWLVSKRAAQFLNSRGVDFRPIKNTEDYQQVVFHEKCSVDVESHSVEHRDPCPSCERYLVQIETDALDGLSLTCQSRSPRHFADRTLTVLDTPGGLSESREVFGRFYQAADESPLVLDEKLPSRSFNPRSQTLYHFAPATLVYELLDRGFTGLAFRPVNVSSRAEIAP